MMKLFSRLKKPGSKPVVGNITEIARIVGPLIDDLSNDIFIAYREVLLAETITYIVPAVWGATKDTTLTPDQQGINDRAAPVIAQVMHLLQADTMNEKQAFAVGFIIRGLIISKITYMIEALKNKLMSMDGEKKDFLIKHMEPMGHA